MAVTVSLLLAVVIIGGTYGNEIVNAATSLFQQVFGSFENAKQVDPHVEERVVEEELQIAKDVLTESEFKQYTALIQEQTNIMKKAIEVVDGEQKIYMERLTKEEKETLDRNEKQLTPLHNKIDQHFVYSMDQAAEKFPFPVKRPDYVPAGYTLTKEEATAASSTGTFSNVSFTYDQIDGEFGYRIIQSAILTGEQDEYSLWDADGKHEEVYDLEGNQVKYAKEGKNVTMMKMIVPEKGGNPSYQIFIIADMLQKEDLEKIALSMLEK